MNTLITFATRFGCTEKCAKKLEEKLSNDMEIINLKNNTKISLDKYDTVIIGGSIMMGKINSEVKKFYNNNLAQLLQKKIGLFICGALSEQVDKELRDNFPEELINHAVATGYFGYELNFEKMNFALRVLAKKMSDTEKSFSKIIEDNITKFAEVMKR
ncbi:MAG: flavodoxin [Actinobacteria bacterium]|nr:flavodoxin [Actinomycetota bacterium]